MCTSEVPDPSSQEGCYTECPPGAIVLPDMTCGAAAKPTYWVEVHCPEDPVVPEEEECDGVNQFLFNSDCTKGYYCKSSTEIYCPPSTFISFDFSTVSFSCTTEPDETTCRPGMGGYTFWINLDTETTAAVTEQTTSVPPTVQGTPLETFCHYADGYAANPLGTCAAAGQLWSSEDCTQAFYCSGLADDEPAPAGTDGCLKTCAEGERLEISRTAFSASWECVEREAAFLCPGKFNTNPAMEVACECENQMWVDPDCRGLFTCAGPMVDGENVGTQFVCPVGQVVKPGLMYPLEHRCEDDDGQCPGWYKMGCSGGDFGALEPVCVPTVNPLGICECEGQLFYGSDSTEAFVCRSDVDDGDGCLLQCPEDQRVPLDLDPAENWRCTDREADFNSPGAFATDCEPGFHVSCGCEGEVRVVSFTSDFFSPTSWVWL